MEHVYIVKSIGDNRLDNIIGIFEDLDEAKKCAEAMSIIKEREWTSSKLYFDVHRTFLMQTNAPRGGRYMIAACWQDEMGICRARKMIYYVTSRPLNHCILQSEEYKNIVKGL